MKISLIKPNSVNINPWVKGFERAGVEVCVNYCTKDCNFILGASHSQVRNIIHVHNQFPLIPMINYNWDLYGWIDVHSTAGYNWKAYGEVLKNSLEIWTPSEEVNIRTGEFFDLEKKCRIIKTFARLFDYDGEIEDNRYIYQPMRYYTKDKNFGWLKKVCHELDIPLYESLHRLSESEFQKVIAGCSFMVTEYHEASTGGLTLIEGYRLGKPVVVSDSKYMGARDYFGDKAIYFNDNSYEDFKQTIKNTWEETPKLDIESCREYTEQYSLQKMIDEMTKRMYELKK
jgi:hypothetical protein